MSDNMSDQELEAASVKYKAALSAMSKATWERVLNNVFWNGTHPQDCMCPTCLQQAVDIINGAVHPVPVESDQQRCECGAVAAGSSAHSAWCPLHD